MKRAFLFPGQGAQTIGMGKDFYEQFEEAKEVFEKASKISGIDVAKLCFEGPEEKLNKTENTQIAILTTSMAILKVLQKRKIQADIAVGLSLGEYSALIYAGILNIEEGIKLIQKRGYYMANLLPEGNYSMAAVIGLENSKIEAICEQLRKEAKFVVPANYNCSTQTAIAGEEIAVQEAIGKLKEAGARKVIPLKTSGPFHTEKLKDAKNAYEKELAKVKFQLGNKKVIKNLDGKYYTKEDNIKEILAKHIISPVRFDQAIQLMKQEQIEEYIEIGPGKVLTGFVKKDEKEAKTFAIHSVESLEQYLEEEENKHE